MPKETKTLDPLTASLLAISDGKTFLRYVKGYRIFSQGDEADALFYSHSGRIKLTVLSETGREAVVGILGDGAFFGEGCLAGQWRRTTSAVAMLDCSILRFRNTDIEPLLESNAGISETFRRYLITRISRIEGDLVDRILNSSERRLARVLLLLSNDDIEPDTKVFMPKISQENLAEIVGTTRSRVSFFMNRFRDLGFLEYNARGIQVYSSRLKTVLRS